MTHTPPSLKSQLFGAAAGCAAALVLYGAYLVASPVLTALLPSKDEGMEHAVHAQNLEIAAEREERMSQIAARARSIAEEMRAGWYVPGTGDTVDAAQVH